MKHTFRCNWHRTADGQRVTFTGTPTKADRDTWCAWLERHSIPINDVPIDGWVERRPAKRQIAYVAYVRNEAGKILLDHNGQCGLREERLVQLEAEPAPFPEMTP